MKFIHITLSLLFLASTLYAAEAKMPKKIMESFEEGIPAYLTTRGGKLSIDTLRYKHANQALKWDWVGNDALVFDTHIGYRKQRDLSEISKEGADEHLLDEHSAYDNKVVLEPPRGFFMWIYNEKATTQRLTFQFGRDELVDCEFDYILNFKGWRTVWIIYDRGDMRGTPHPDMNRMTILAPAIGSGSYYIDAVGLSLPLNPRNNAPNMQLPFIDPHPRIVTQYAQRLLEHYNYKPSFGLEPLNTDTEVAMNKLNEKAEEFILTTYEKENLSHKGVDDLIKQYAKFEITRDGANIYGRPLVKDNVYKEYFKEMGLGKEILKGHMSWRYDFGAMLLKIAKRYHSISDEKQKTTLENMFVDLFDYGIDQGFDVGEGLGWLHHYSYEIREYGPAMFLMRNVLDKHDRLDKAIDIMKWFYAFGQVYREDIVYGVKGRKAADADDTQGLLIPRLYTALIQKNSPEKVRDLKHFSSFFSNVTANYANALDEVYKPDGTAFHHAGHAMGYGGRGVQGGAAVMYLLSHSPFKATAEAQQRMKKITTTLFDCLYTPEYKSPRAFASIRFSTYELPKHFYYLPALVALSTDEFDAEMAGFYQQIMETVEDKGEMDTYWLNKIQAQGAAKEYNYSKSRMLSYSSVLTRRENNNWMATVRGHSKYVYPYESWGTSFFAYPAFIANGYLDVSYPNSLDATQPEKGTWQKGYDWHRWPGVTSVNVPYEQIITSPGQQKDEGGEYPFSDQAFVGGVETVDGNGVFVFPFKGHDMYDLQSFTGKKSYFIFDDLVVCLGSHINSGIQDYPVETTILQDEINSKNDILMTSNGDLNKLPYESTIDKTEPFWILDKRGTGYYIPEVPKNTSLTIQRVNQTNPGYQNLDTVNGDFSSVYLNHGVAPENATYNYAVVIDANKDKMNSFVTEMKGKKKPYEIIQKSDKAHIVKSAKHATTSYAIFDKNAELKTGLVKKVNRPTTLVVKEQDQGIKLAVSDPDLNIYDGQDDLMPDGSRCEVAVYSHEWFCWPSRPTKVRITLAGKWNIKEQIKEMETASAKKAKIISSDKKQTTIEFECKDGLSAEVLLTKN